MHRSTGVRGRVWNIVNRVPWDPTPPSTLIVLHQQKPRDSGRVGAGKAKRMKIPQKEVFLRHWQDMQTRNTKRRKESKFLGYNCIERILVNSKQVTRELSTIYKFRSFAMTRLYTSWMVSATWMRCCLNWLGRSIQDRQRRQLAHILSLRGRSRVN